MTNEEISYQTKSALRDALRDSMTEKTFSKITVSELIQKCNINRKTFYYHFEDIYALLKWSLEQEAISVVSQYDMLTEYPQVIRFVYDYIKNNNYLINCTFDDIGRNALKNVFFDDFNKPISSVVLKLEERMDVHLSPSDEKFLCQFIAEGIIGMLINLFQENDVENAEEIVRHFGILVNVGVPEMIRELNKKK